MGRGKYGQISSLAVVVTYFAATVTMHCDWTRRTDIMNSHFNDTVCRTVYVPLIRNLLYSAIRTVYINVFKAMQTLNLIQVEAVFPSVRRLEHSKKLKKINKEIPC
jgi:hypothetical protein